MIESFLRIAANLPGTDLLPGRVKSVLRACANDPVFPTMLNIEPNRRCNLRCVMCHLGQDPSDTRPDMSLETFKRIVCQFPKALEMVTIQGLGEPLLNRSLLDMVEFCRERGLLTRFNTNMTIMNEEIAERLVRCGHTEVQVSLETTDPALYADIRRGAKLERVMRNLELLENTKKRLGSNLPEINVHGILIKAVIPTIPAMVETLKAAGVHHLLLSDLGVLGDAQLRDGTTMAENSLPATMSEDEIAAILSGIKKLETPDFHISVPGEWYGLRTGAKAGAGIMTCKELWEAPYITCDGYATPCCVVPDPDTFKLGNYNKMTFEQIWFGEAYHRLRWEHMMNRHSGPCRNCARLVCTFVEPSRLKAGAAVQQRYTKCFVDRRFVLDSLLPGIRRKSKDPTTAIEQPKAVEERKLGPRTQRVVDGKQCCVAGPWEMVLFPTNRCNLKCNICWQRWAIEEFGEVDTKNEISDERWLDLIDEGASLDVRGWVIVGGGEPMMRRDLVLNMAKKILRSNMWCTLHTNGTMLKTDVIDQLIEMGLNELVFSIDASDRETNDDIRSPGAFDRATAAIRKLVELKAKKDKQIPSIRIAGVLTSTNYTKVVDFVEFFHGLGCNDVTLATLAEQGSSCRRFILSAEQQTVAVENIRAAMARAGELGVGTNFDVLVRRMEGTISRESVRAQTCAPLAEGMCFEPWGGMTIQPNGLTGPCCVSYDEQAPSIANLDLDEIWNGPYFERLRERAVKNQPMNYCELCPMHLLDRTRCMKDEITRATASDV